MSILYREKSYEIMGACFNVYRDKGVGFLESVYQECLEIEFDFLEIPYLSQHELNLEHRGQKLKKTFKPDFICFDKIILEIKAITGLANDHRAQVHNYLKAAEMKLGLLVNFCHYPKLEYERIVLTKPEI